ncbi:MAG: NHL repeat-containing protein [Acidobacteriota bacterium]
MTPNRVYVADSLNNRILGFKDVRSIGADLRSAQTTEPDIIIGQPDKRKTGPNYPAYDDLVPSDQGLSRPSGLTVDSQGNLWVADTFNGRILRFPTPFNQPAGTVPRANLVLGQANFTFTVPDASSSTMARPGGVVVFNNGDVAASDLAHNRVLLFHKTGADFTNGQPARAVLGQQTFFSTGASSTSSGLNTPRGMAVDTGDRLYVADSGNNRVLVYPSTGNTPNGASGIVIPGGALPESVAVSGATGEIFIAALNDGRISRSANFHSWARLHSRSR